RVHLQSYAAAPMNPRPARATVAFVTRRWFDIAIAAALTVAMVLVISAAPEPSSREPDAFAYLVGVALGPMVLLHRRWPLGAVFATVGTLMVYYANDYPAFPPAIALAPTAFFAALAGRGVQAAMVAGGFLLFGTGWQTIGEGTSLTSVLGSTTLADATLLIAVLLLGDTIRSRRAHAEEVRARERAEADRRLEDERMRIARDLHDVLGHTIVGVSVQASVVADVIDEDPAEAKAALQNIREQTNEALTELRAAVGLLRADAPRSPAPGLAALEGLVASTRDAGVKVDIDVDGDPRPLPRAVELTAYRIVQESLTNVIRHAQAKTARVAVRYSDDALDIEITDDGRGADAPEGHGLTGMRERAAAVGGTVVTGRAPGGGFRVHTHLPT
ncbi:MAG TPA: sensor histidine kinase, partial [Solirubrobacter sp.]|nr:sensor histidine kinase [Solirubrobacter sp.]